MISEGQEENCNNKKSLFGGGGGGGDAVSQQRNLGRPLTHVMNMDLLCSGLSGLECVSLLRIVSCCCCCCPAAWDDHPCSYHQDRH